MFYFDDYDIKDFDDYAIEELTEITERLNRIAGQYKFGTEEFSFFCRTWRPNWKAIEN